MALLLINLVGLPSARNRVQLDGASYSLAFRWNERAQAFAMDVYNEADEPIIQGKRLVLRFPLLAQYGRRKDLPPGNLFADAGEDIEITRDNFGTKVRLYYYEAGP